MGKDSSSVDEASRAAALMVSGLMTTPQDELDDFRRRRLGPERAISVERLRRLREVLGRLGEALSTDDEASWDLVDRAHSLLAGNEAAFPPSVTSGPSPGSLPYNQPLSCRSGGDTLTGLARGSSLATTVASGSHLTLTEYAVLSASCGAFPSRVREIHTMFGVDDPPARQALDDAWQAHFQEQDEARELRDALVARFRAWLVEHGGY